MSFLYDMLTKEEWKRSENTMGMSEAMLMVFRKVTPPESKRNLPVARLKALKLNSVT